MEFEVISNKDGIIRFTFGEGYSTGDRGGVFEYKDGKMKNISNVVVKGNSLVATKSCPRRVSNAAFAAVREYLGL